jgi:hypothetical protein
MELGLLFWPQTPGLISWGPQVQVLPGAPPFADRCTTLARPRDVELCSRYFFSAGGAAAGSGRSEL